MEYVFIGKFVNTHGLKGEIRILSDFKYKKLVFIPNMTLFIGEEKKPFIIRTYRVHKNYDMVTFVGVNSINDIEFLKGNLVYINKADLNLSDKDFLIEDLIGYQVYVDKNYVGNIIEYISGVANDILVVGEKRILIPYIDEFIIKIIPETKKIYIKNIKGMV